MACLMARHEWDWVQAEHHCQQAIKLAPHSAELHRIYAVAYLLPVGRSEEALAEIRRARELDPFLPAFALENANVLLMTGQFAAAEQEFRSILARGLDSRLIRALLAGTLIWQGRDREAAAEAELAAAMDGPPRNRDAFVASTLAAVGDPSAAEDLLAYAERDAGKHYVPAMHLAYIHSTLQRTEEFLSDLEQACRNREHPLVFAKVNFMYDPVREHPRFQAILRELNLA
jgi:tetratricopeptide (TPR) repeat protein